MAPRLTRVRCAARLSLGFAIALTKKEGYVLRA
jgi:hypothetical protein